MPTSYPYTHITVQPPNKEEYNAQEVWGAFTATHKGLGTFDSDGIIGFLYQVGTHYVWLNEVGHPTEVWASFQDLIGWLQTKAPTIEFATTYKQPGERS